MIVSSEQTNAGVTTMKAIRQHEFGGPEVLRYERCPNAGKRRKGEVLVKVKKAIGLNPPDWYLREGYMICCLRSGNRRCHSPSFGHGHFRV